ncbi:helix-turn-helix transcriptional regulator [Pelomonas sp. KK5]|uniref:ArsR/SmtB family transcription factor n=1 Tax=Pelomonas sp. KK5 TaxID=1855730 RepID=UPI00097BE23F|nr:metalloregulator ArsR/SmtB family transcription factor [Pelomonas sp. KK5]
MPAAEEEQADPLDAVFRALGDATRRKLVHRLAQGEATVSELAEPFDMSLPAVSKHLVVLENAGLLKRRVDGRTHYCSLAPEALAGALDWITIYRQFWTRRLGGLAEHLKKER